MAAMTLMTQLLERTMIYSLWQAPFAADKLAPLLAHNDLREVRRVLDVGCGPGTNTRLFAHADYLGIDINQDYIENARRKYKRPFVAADVTTYDDNTLGTFDFILINSFLHHLIRKEFSLAWLRGFRKTVNFMFSSWSRPKTIRSHNCWPTGIVESIRVRSKNGGRYLKSTWTSPFLSPIRLDY
jgi:SAM-dependent methyltransferase